ncbi:CRISPR-associated helicase Cas3' [Alkalinema pantanalense CENA528]|uniref:type I-G CRISPR-associated helicase/endonuclease Cas3g n=1 Tax=Alkalinema pantanalense TaxID=1620705 RepID=UPI003D6DF21A
MSKNLKSTDRVFADWFESVTGHSPYLYQQRLANLTKDWPIVIEVPTGLGKTAAIVFAWFWKRRYSNDSTVRSKTPRRLVYILPTRTLVDQTVQVIEQWCQKLEDLDPQKNDPQKKYPRVAVHQLMGGMVSTDWDRDPTADCIIVGTQDQILSRCLNRGYGVNKYKWPVQFGLLNQDCLFVVDETQLMGAGLRTTAQLQGLRELWTTFGQTQTIWMSATLDTALLTTVNYQPQLELPGARLRLKDPDSKEDLQEPAVLQRLNARKNLQKFPIACPAKEKDEGPYIKALAEQVDNAFKATGSNGLVLVICNRVRRAQALYEQLRSKGPTLLIHSRFRTGDRQPLNQKLLSKDLSGIIIATQAVEAGVDISAHYLFTELSPWSSFVQRVGRCNRNGEHNEAVVYWIDFDNLSEESARPYDRAELEQTKTLLDRLQEVGPAALAESLSDDEKPKPKIEGMIPRKHDLMQLFDTSSDLAGHDIDISPFIRDTQNMEVAIAWRNWSGDAPPADFPVLYRDELCQVNIGQAKAFLKKTAGFVFDRLQKQWKKVDERSISPGQTILVNCQSGGYSETLGFTGDPKQKPQPIPLPLNPAKPEGDDDDFLSKGAKSFVSLKQHSEDIVSALNKILEALPQDGLETLPIEKLERAARLHDAGKAHPIFQQILTHKDVAKMEEGLWAKSGDLKSQDKSDSDDHKSKLDKYGRPKDKPDKDDLDRRGFRHELVSALLALQRQEPFLVTYLVAAHHGRIRLTIQPRPTEQAPKQNKRYALGVHEGDELPKIDLGGDLSNIPPTRISLACMELGGTREVREVGDGTVELVGERSWTEQAVELLEEYGPFRLAYLEALLRIADWNASAKAGVSLEMSDAV